MSFSYTVRPADWKATLRLVFEEDLQGETIDLVSGILSIGTTKGLGDIISYIDYLKKTTKTPIIIENISITSDKLIRDIYGLEEVIVKILYYPETKNVIVSQILGDKTTFNLIPDLKLLQIMKEDVQEYEYIIPLM